MSRAFLFSILFLRAFVNHGQSTDKLILKGNYTKADSTHMVESYLIAKEAVAQMHNAMKVIWDAEVKAGQSKEATRKEKWEKEKMFTQWLGQPEHIGLVNRKINRIKAKFDRSVILHVTKENKGRCSDWISAWAIPFGRVRITLCEDFFVYRTHLQEKTLIHEMGHESGIFLHRKIHGCRAARRAASSNDKVAKRSTENYAWLAMSYKGLVCPH